MKFEFPLVFYKFGEIEPIKFTFLCAYPCNSNYAVYLNEQTKLPERVHHSDIIHFDYDDCFEKILNAAKSTVDLILKIKNIK